MLITKILPWSGYRLLSRVRPGVKYVDTKYPFICLQSARVRPGTAARAKGRAMHVSVLDFGRIFPARTPLPLPYLAFAGRRHNRTLRGQDMQLAGQGPGPGPGNFFPLSRVLLCTMQTPLVIRPRKQATRPSCIMPLVLFFSCDAGCRLGAVTRSLVSTL